MNSETIYTALKEYVETGLQAVAIGTADNSLKVELAESDLGEEWTGIRMAKLPVATTKKAYISGGGLVDYTFQLVSKQQIDHTIAGAIGYSTYLEKIADELRRLCRAGRQPRLAEGAVLKSVKAVQQSTMTYNNESYSGYVLDMRFTLELRRL